MNARVGTVGLGLASVALLAGCARAGGEPAQYTANGGLNVDLSHAVSQTVNPAGDQVKAVDVLVLAKPEEGDGALHLALAADGEVLAEQSVDLDEVDGPDQWVSFAFDAPVTVPDVVDVQLTVSGEGSVLVGANTTPENANPSKEPTHDAYPQGEAVANGITVNGDIAFRVVGTSEPRGVAGQIGTMVKEGAKRLSNQPGFAAIWAGGLLVALGLAVWGFATRKRG